VLGSKANAVPVKVVPSVSPVNGNAPSFTVARVAPASATLVDFTVFTASNSTGEGTSWAKEYSFGETYHETSYSGASLADLIGRMRADTAGTSAESQNYQRHFFKGVAPIPWELLWQKYVCSLDHPTAEGFKACACGGN
jgi:sphingomyelin phosphodiesterase acid-like 3